MPLRLEIVTPNRIAYSDDVDMVVIPAVEGEMGILPMHIPLMTTIKPGELDVTKDGKTVALAVGEGFVEVTPTGVNIITDMAIEVDEIDENLVQQAIERAEAQLQEKSLEGEELATVEATLQRSLAHIAIKRKRSPR